MKTNLTVIDKMQMSFIEDNAVFPSTRFQGSKLKLVTWIWDCIKDMNFDSVLDAFAGTGSVAYMLKNKGKEVTYNDILKFNWYIGTALIQNDNVKLSCNDLVFLVKEHKNINYPTFVSDTFKSIYFTDEENRWIDIVVTNISLLEGFYKKALAYFALFQACIIKRPYNLFHRKNLYIRLSDVERNFGNKVTWDTPFQTHFQKFAEEANRAVFCNGRQNTAVNMDVFALEGPYDLVYIDPPYISKKGVGVDYLGFYHFLEGLVNYPQWAEMIDYKTRHKRLKTHPSVWTDKKAILSAFDRLFKKFKRSILVVSYRADGIPSIDQLVRLLKKHKSQVDTMKWKNYKYVLSINNSEEVLLIGR
ncbi:MAG TPA: DNA adenine methylase [Sedimentisphaerales bacterium]|nr:DNA adenine methylase [Sedimentisphaerales bacterium]